MPESLPGNEETNGLLQRLLGADSDQQERRVGWNLALGFEARTMAL